MIYPKKPPKRRPPKGLPPVPPLPPRGGIFGVPPGQPTWTGQYPPGTIQNYHPVVLALRRAGVI